MNNLIKKAVRILEDLFYVPPSQREGGQVVISLFGVFIIVIAGLTAFVGVINTDQWRKSQVVTFDLLETSISDIEAAIKNENWKFLKSRGEPVGDYGFSHHAIRNVDRHGQWNAVSIATYIVSGQCKPEICQSSREPNKELHMCSVPGEEGKSIMALVVVAVEDGYKVLTGYKGTSNFWQNQCKQ